MIYIHGIWEASVKGSALLALAWLATALLRRAPADLRHKIWLAALIGTALLLVPMPLPYAVQFDIPASIAAPPAAFGSSPVPWLAIVWAAGALAILLRAAIGICLLARVPSQASGEDGIRFSDAVSTPCTWGLLRPVILLPRFASAWSPEQWEWTIRHERAHIARRDWTWQMFAQAMTAVFWFHPLVWLAATRLRAEAEYAADDQVLSSGADAPAYAEQLLDVARRLHRPAPSHAVAMVRSAGVAQRVEAILERGRIRNTSSMRSRIALAAAVLLCVGGLSAGTTSTLYPVNEPGMTPPSVAQQVDATYTEQARKAKWQGTVGLRMVIDERGRARDVQVAQPLGLGLDQSAMDAVKQWRFRPGTRNGKPVRVTARVEVKFRLQ